MIARNYILTNLRELEKLYRNSTKTKETTYYSKLALLELCGWIEESMDDIIIKHANRKLSGTSSNPNKNYVKRKVIDKNNGFVYKDNFRPMLMKLIGIIELEKLEKPMKVSGKLSILSSTLARLKTARNDAAHTHIKGLTRNYDAPSITIRNFEDVYKCLLIIDAKLRQY